MVKSDKSKRTFFKKISAAAGFVAAAGYLGDFIASRSSSTQAINERSENDVEAQKRAWRKMQMVAMSDDDKKQMLDEIIDIHNKYRA